MLFRSVYTALEKASLADIKPGTYIGVTSLPQADGSLKAVAVHLFPEAARGTGEGHRAWDQQPQSMMTNATVETAVAGVDGEVIMVKYKDGEKKVVVPPGTVIAKYVPGGPEDLKVGAKVFVGGATKQADGTLLAPNIAVGRDIDPPQ